MSDLIDRQAVIKAITNAADKFDWPDDYHQAMKEGIRIGTLICSLMPSKQPEIIYCRDCRHYTFADNRAFGFPAKRCEWTGFEDVDDDDFCSRAERREVSETDG